MAGDRNLLRAGQTVAIAARANVRPAGLARTDKLARLLVQRTSSS